MSQLIPKKPVQYLNKMQEGGTLLDKLLKSKLTNSTSKQDNVGGKPLPKLQPQVAQKDMFGKIVPQPRWQGEIKMPEEKSLRENLLTSLGKLDRNGDNAVIGTITTPVRAGLNLLRPDKYFEGVKGDGDILPAIGKLGMDAATVAPILSEFRALRGVRPVSSEGRNIVGYIDGISDKKPLLDKAKDGVNKALETKFIPGKMKQVLPQQLSIQPVNIGKKKGIDGLAMVDEKGKSWGRIFTQPEGEWASVQNIRVDPALQGKKLQDVLYQAAIKDAQSKDMYGVMSGQHLISPAKTVKAHSRFNREVFDVIETDGIEHGIVGLTGHQNPNVIADWMDAYKDIPKVQRDKLSIMDLIRGPKLQQSY